MNKLNFTKLVTDTRIVLDKHSPEILLGLGIAGMITTTVLAVRATPKAVKRIEQKKEEEHKDKLTVGETIKATWKFYIPAAITCVSSTACLIGSNSVQAKRTAAIATAYKISETALTEYREKVKEAIGEKKEKVLREEITAEKAAQHNAGSSTVYVTGGGTVLCLDPLSGRLFKSNRDVIKHAQNEINERLLTDPFGYVSLNDFYEELGLDPTDVGDDLGWNVSTGKVHIDFGSGLTKDQEPCLVMEYRVAPKRDYQ